MSAPEPARPDALARLDAAARLGTVRLQAENAGEFALMLRSMLDAADLTAGQVAVKAGIPRSQAYSMVNTKRSTLPAKSEQVARFASACGATAMQTDIVLGIHQGLLEQAQRQQQEQLERKDAGTEVVASDTTNSVVGDAHGVVVQASSISPVEMEPKWSKTRPPSLFEFLRFVLMSEDRVRNLIRLLYPVAVVCFGVLVLLGFIVWRDPALGLPITVGLGATFSLVTMMLGGSYRRRR